MADAAEQWVTVATRLTEARVNELALVLTARGVSRTSARPAPGGWELWVPLASAPAAATQLTLYRHENARQIGARPIEEVGEGRAGVIWYVATLLAGSWRCTRTSSIAIGSAPAGSTRGPLLGGEWWRAVTALTLHIELDHLGGNLAFGAFFGYFIGRYLGAGVGWLAVLLAAGGANVLNAWAQGPAHRSIGASTAVFAALGLLVAYTWAARLPAYTPWRARIAPIVAGLGLLAFTGTAGENTRSRRAPVRFHRRRSARRRHRGARADRVAQAAPGAAALRCGGRARARSGLGRGATRSGLALEGVGDELEEVALVATIRRAPR